VRDEAFRLLQELESDHDRSVIADRVIVISAFIRDDIDNLGLRKEYDEVERLLLGAIDDFPQQSAAYDRRDLESFVRSWLPGQIEPNREIFGVLLESTRSQEIQSQGILLSLDNCTKCVEFWRYFRHRWSWPEYGSYGPQYRWLDDFVPVSHCGFLGWAIGAAEALAACERHMAGIDAVRSWSRERVPQLNDALLAFERRLHEVIFGPL
jgi:hypothetical protein